jgi:hypothetical protein
MNCLGTVRLKNVKNHYTAILYDKDKKVAGWRNAE